jgi:hypothetical protein
MLKDKYEKQIIKKFTPRSNHLGRAVYLPIIFICFTIFILNRLTPTLFFVNCVFLVAYIYFFFEDFVDTVGVDIAELPMFASYSFDGTAINHFNM